MLRRFPQAHLATTRDDFGVWLDGQTWMRVSYRGNWTAADMRDCLALFATWCVADPNRIITPGERLDGCLRTVTRALEQSNTRED